MKKNYKELQVNVISLEDTDVITASFANRSYFESLLEGGFDLGDYSHQGF